MVLVPIAVVNAGHENITVGDQLVRHWLVKRVIVERLSVCWLGQFLSVSQGNLAETIRRDLVAGEFLPWSHSSGGLARCAGIAGHINRNQLALAVLPVREIPGSLEHRRD